MTQRVIFLRIRILLLMLPLAAPVTATTAVIEVEEQQYEISYLIGTFVELEPVLREQVWWGDPDLALLFAATLQDELQAPRPGLIGLFPLLFSWTDFEGFAGEGFNTGVANYVTGNPSLPAGAYRGSARIVFPFGYAVARETTLPLPGSGGMIFLGCLLLWAKQTRR